MARLPTLKLQNETEQPKSNVKQREAKDTKKKNGLKLNLPRHKQILTEITSRVLKW